MKTLILAMTVVLTLFGLESAPTALAQSSSIVRDGKVVPRSTQLGIQSDHRTLRNGTT